MNTFGIREARWQRRLGVTVGIMLGLMVGVLVSTSMFNGFSASAAKSGHGDDSAREIIGFKTMTGNTAPYIGSAVPIRGVNAGGLPWQVKKAKGELKSDGSLEVDIKGLVLLDGPPVPESRRGTNPSPVFRALVSCLSVDADGNSNVVNVSTDAFPATPDGNAEIEAMVALPSPCIAPIVFITSGGGSWFAATGF